MVTEAAGGWDYSGRGRKWEEGLGESSETLWKEELTCKEAREVEGGKLKSAATKTIARNLYKQDPGIT